MREPETSPLSQQNFPKPLLTDKALEAEMIKVLKASNTYKERIKGEVIKLVIVDPDWTIRRNELTGIILDRYIRATASSEKFRWNMYCMAVNNLSTGLCFKCISPNQIQWSRRSIQNPL
jgi:hypothetical protein